MVIIVLLPEELDAILYIKILRMKIQWPRSGLLGWRDETHSAALVAVVAGSALVSRRLVAEGARVRAGGWGQAETEQGLSKGGVDRMTLRIGKCEYFRRITANLTSECRHDLSHFRLRT